VIFSEKMMLDKVSALFLHHKLSDVISGGKKKEEKKNLYNLGN